MDESAFWVGPADHPDRYRLTHLLGSGGEGEVWRAVRTGDNATVAIKIDRIPDGHDLSWEQRLESIVALRIEGLVRVEEAFAGTVRRRADEKPRADRTHRYIVMEYVEGLTLRAWLDEHPTASIRRRMKILRGVAGTLSRLHRGRGGRGIVTHGDVKPTNIVVGPQGDPVLVDLGLLRPAGSGPVSGRSAAYSSPELRNPDSTPSPRADTFSFAVTAMETLTSLTPPLDVDGSLDLPATRRRIRSARALRMRPMLRWQLLRSLAPQPDGRPPTPMRVFVGRTAVIALVPAVVIFGLGGSAVALRAQGDAPAAPTTTSPSGSRTTVVVSPPRPPTRSAPSRPIVTASPSSASPQAPTASPTPTTAPAPVPQLDNGQIISGDFTGGDLDGSAPPGCGPRAGSVIAPPTKQGWSWGSSPFVLTLTSSHQVQVLSVTRKRTTGAAPSRLEQSLSVSCTPGASVSPPTCHRPGPQPYRTEAKYLADLDANTFREIVTDNRPLGVLDYKCAPPTELRLNTQACSGNYDYYLILTYQVAGDPSRTYTQRFGPLHVRARVRHVSFVTKLDRLTSYTTPNFSGGPAGCARRGVSTTTPYSSVRHEADELLVKAVRERRAAAGLSTMDAIKQIVQEIGGSGPGYDAAGIMALCQAAWTQPGWRGTCGPEESVSPAPASP